MNKMLKIMLITTMILVGCQNKVDDMILKPTKEISNRVLEFYEDLSIPVSFDFVVNKEIVSYDLNQYKLIDGKWIENGISFGSNLNVTEGSLAFNADVDTKYMVITTLYGTPKKGEIVSSGGFYKTDNKCKYVSLNEEVEIIYEEEIPILVRVDTNEELTQTFIANKEELANQFQDYEDVYLITIKFSNTYIK